MRLAQHPRPRPVGLDDGERAIGGTIVDDDEFVIPKGLREHALNGLADEPFRIEGGHDDADASMSPRPRAAEGGVRGVRHDLSPDPVTTVLRGSVSTAPWAPPTRRRYVSKVTRASTAPIVEADPSQFRRACFPAPWR